MRFALFTFVLCPFLSAVTITTPGSPREVIISGVADGKLNSYKNSLWIVSDTDIKALAALPNALAGPGGPIPVSNIHLTWPGSLDKNVPKEAIVVVDTALVVGDFEGKLLLSVPADQTISIDPIPVKLHLAPKVSVLPVPTPFSFQLVACGAKITCQIADLLVPTLARTSRPWRMTNVTPATVEWRSSSLILRGDKTGAFLDTIERKPTLPTQISANNNASASFDFNRGTIQSDHYQGQYRAEIVGADTVVVPFTLDVRDSPLLALVVLILGIVLGRIIQNANSAVAQSQIHLLDKYHVVTEAVDVLENAPIKEVLRLQLSQSLIDIRTMARSETDITSQLNLILTLAADSEKLDRLDALIRQITDIQKQQALSDELAKARSAILAGKVTVVDQEIAQINAMLSDVLPTTMVRTAVAPRPTPSPAAPAKPDPLARGIAWLAGATPINAVWYYRYGRPLMFLLLLVLLVSVGFYSSYIKNATFGADGYFDYLSLFMWGISADVAQKTLQNISFPRSS